MIETSLVTVDANAPFLDGHFPGEPLVPGVVILELVCAAIERSQGRPNRLEGIPGVKFTSPLRPGERMQIDLMPGASNALVAFKCHVDERAIAEGTLRLLADKP